MPRVDACRLNVLNCTHDNGMEQKCNVPAGIMMRELSSTSGGPVVALFQNISGTDAWNNMPFETVINQYFMFNITYFQVQN